MANLDHYVKKVGFPREEYDLIETIRNESNEGFKFKQIISAIDEGSTECSALLVFEKDVNLIPTNIFYYNEEGEEVSEEILLTPSKIDLLRKIGYIEIDQVRYNIKEVIPCWRTEEDLFYCVIETEAIKDDSDFISQVG